MNGIFGQKFLSIVKHWSYNGQKRYFNMSATERSIILGFEQNKWANWNNRWLKATNFQFYVHSRKNSDFDSWKMWSFKKWSKHSSVYEFKRLLLWIFKIFWYLDKIISILLRFLGILKSTNVYFKKTVTHLLVYTVANV